MNRLFLAFVHHMLRRHGWTRHGPFWTKVMPTKTTIYTTRADALARVLVDITKQ